MVGTKTRKFGWGMRISYIGLTWIITYGCAYWYSEEIINIFMLEGSWETGKFILTEITEAFKIKIEVSMFITMWWMIPIIVHQVWSFIKGGLYEYEKKEILKWIWGVGILMIINIIITYKIIIPATCNFFLFQSDELTQMLYKETRMMETIQKTSTGMSEWENMSSSGNEQVYQQATQETKIDKYVRFIESTFIWTQIILQMPAMTLLCLRLGGKGFVFKVKKEVVRNFVVGMYEKMGTSVWEPRKQGRKVWELRNLCQSKEKGNVPKRAKGKELVPKESWKNVQKLERRVVCQPTYQREEEIYKDIGRSMIIERRRVNYVIIILLSGMIASGEMISQMVLTMTIIILYEILIFLTLCTLVGTDQKMIGPKWEGEGNGEQTEESSRNC